jgi:hypothetical protein
MHGLIAPRSGGMAKPRPAAPLDPQPYVPRTDEQVITRGAGDGWWRHRGARRYV